jgi:hypothetical protein
MMGFNSFVQTDFLALKQQFLDYRKAEKQDSALFIARKINKLAQKEILNKYPTIPEKWAGFVLVR